jgi:hypothetical protein
MCIYKCMLNVPFLVALIYSATIDGRNLIFGHKLQIGTPYRGKHFLTRQIPTSCFADFVDFYTHWIYILYMPILSRIFLSNYWWQKSDIWSQGAYTKCMFSVYKNRQSRQTGSRNLMGPKTLPTIWGTHMKLVTKYQISAINSCWEKCDFWTRQIPTSCLPILLIFLHI